MTGRILARERRSAARTSYDAMVMLLQDDGSTWGQVMRGRLTDISDTGLAIRIRERIENRTYLTFRVERLDWSGTGSVRHCTRSKMDYVIGLECAQASGKGR